MRIDAHQHFWDLSKPFAFDWLRTMSHRPICKDFLPADLKPHLDACDLDGAIFVQTQHDVAENRWALELAATNPFILGVVGWVDLASANCEAQIAEFKSQPKFVGVRHIVQDEPDDDFIVRPAFLRGLGCLEGAGVPYDLLFFVKHLRHAATVAEKFPGLRLVIDHLAKPRIRDGATEDWLPDFRRAARCPNVFCKLSGMTTEADWQKWRPADFKLYVDAALESFGPSRLMYGSDWPVCELAATYERQYAALVDCLGKLSTAEESAIFGGTARTFYAV